LVTVVAALLSGCGGPVPDDPNPEQTEAVTGELKNGTLYNGNAVWRGAVGLYIWSPLYNAWQTCSGQVVSRRTIMTAAHCVIRGSSSNPGLTFVQAWRPTQNSGSLIVTSQWVESRYNPDYLSTCETPYDVGLFISPTDLQNITATDAGIIAKTTPSNIRMLAFGFGYYEDAPNAYDDQGRYGVVTPTYLPRSAEYTYQSTGTQPQICNQDSGGPLKNAATTFVHGVASRHTGEGDYCRPIGHWAATANNMYWLRGNISGDCLETSTMYTCW
jgi:hypothetical protein